MNAVPSNLSKRQIDELAQKAYFVLEADTNPIEQIIVNKISGKIVYQPLDELFISGTLVVKNSEPTIFVNSYEPYQRRRFTLAHELGHYILHSNFGSKDITINRSGESERIEWEANWFAAGFLMPRDKFIEEYRKNPDTFYLSSQFKVSISAINYRIKFLKEAGLLSE
ncbi:ImmA/IrrE family metallo-endopeptidase [Leptospira noguchii]|uniref:PF06114 domain protein n=1 Tax=Leptospira noguchii str. 2001034031 TaxID=1193053 RepID=M6Y630_9LEPT|nr:ImmA/IrrE family metallo-endopeptidase [Leptospira noguchii]EMO87426.1 PF06114 domain protein [Leptospira noguchii str. 2001034031]EMS85806.1 PF06114 domain protein [Leptospira noguchii str. Cascata]UOG37472.1 ImmA/IrrE family metallo-endopeptidase [Leptospira noguchii]